MEGDEGRSRANACPPRTQHQTSSLLPRRRHRCRHVSVQAVAARHGINQVPAATSGRASERASEGRRALSTSLASSTSFPDHPPLILSLSSTMSSQWDWRAELTAYAERNGLPPPPSHPLSMEESLARRPRALGDARSPFRRLCEESNLYNIAARLGASPPRLYTERECFHRRPPGIPSLPATSSDLREWEWPRQAPRLQL